MVRTNRHTAATDPGPQPYLLDGEGAASRERPWADVNALVLLGAVAAVTARGDAVLLGCTSDGGAACIQILAGSHRPRFYPAGSVETDKVLVAIADWATDNRKA